MRCKRALAFGRQPAAKVRTHQMMLAIHGGTGSLQHGKIERDDIGRKA